MGGKKHLFMNVSKYVKYFTCFLNLNEVLYNRYQFSNTMAKYVCRFTYTFFNKLVSRSARTCFLYLFHHVSAIKIHCIRRLFWQCISHSITCGLSFRHNAHTHTHEEQKFNWYVAGLRMSGESFQCDKYDAKLGSKKATKKSGAFKIMPSQQLITFLTLITFQFGGARTTKPCTVNNLLFESQQ